ncbi:SH3 domain-containing protein [uncultured Devosia sp.]|uniref:SH3 domain-containing protein n=1 Tax=uncultured Devosia sp. TaxID=211434 RepID=UPI0035CBB568
MNRHTRTMLLNVATGIAVAAAAALVFLPSAQAAPGVVTSNVNVRSGPGTNFAVVDMVQSGTPVDVQRCEGAFCYVQKPGPDGWISASYLSAQGGRPADPRNPGLSFGFNLGGNGGPSINIGVGNGNPGVFPTNPGRPRPPVYDPPSRSAEVCFYDRTRFNGDSQCFEEGDSVRDLGRNAYSFRSIDNPDGLEVQVCAERNFRDCRTYTTSAAQLGDYDESIVSLRVR